MSPNIDSPTTDANPESGGDRVYDRAEISATVERYLQLRRAAIAGEIQWSEGHARERPAPGRTDGCASRGP